MASNEALRQQLLQMKDRDQAMRKSLHERYEQYGCPSTPEESAQLSAIDAANTQRMKKIIKLHGWPGTSLVGEDGSYAAWLLVQHADRKPAFQKQCVSLLQKAVAEDEASARNLAYLVDRVRLHSGLLQVYGTQCQCIDGTMSLRETEDVSHVDERRVIVGLGPVEEYLAIFKR